MEEEEALDTFPEPPWESGTGIGDGDPKRDATCFLPPVRSDRAERCETPNGDAAGRRKGRS